MRIRRVGGRAAEPSKSSQAQYARDAEDPGGNLGSLPESLRGQPDCCERFAGELLCQVASPGTLQREGSNPAGVSRVNLFECCPVAGGYCAYQHAVALITGFDTWHTTLLQTHRSRIMQ